MINRRTEKGGSWLSAIRSAMCLQGKPGRITRGNVIEDSADAFPCTLRARNEVIKYAGDRKTKRL